MGGSCGNSLLLTPNKPVPTPRPPSQIPIERETFLSQGYIFVLLRCNLTWVSGQTIPDQGTWWRTKSQERILGLLLPSSSKSSDRHLPSLLSAFGWRCSTAQFPLPLCPWGRRWHLCRSPPLPQGPGPLRSCWEEWQFLRPPTLSHSLIGYQSLWPTPKTKQSQFLWA